MALIVTPEDTLDNLKCDYCHKYLSLKPIKVCKKKVACGRCLEKTDEGFVNSLYNNLIENFLFRCVNQYDGCQLLLKSDQVEKHEIKCHNEEYNCQLCVDAITKLPTYLFPTHVKTKHRKAFLNENYFTVDLNSMKEDILFYVKEDYLFFIKLLFNYINKSLLINAVCLRRNNDIRNVFQKYCLFHNGKHIKTKRRICLDVFESDLNKNEIDDIKLDDSENKFMAVVLDFEIVKTTKYIYINSEPQDNCQRDGYPLTLQSVINIALVDIMRNANCMWSRRLNLKCTRNKQFFQTIAISACQTKLVLKVCGSSIFEKMFVCFHCILCKSVIFSMDFDTIRVTRNGTIQHLVCDICSEYVSAYTEIVYLSSLMSLEMYECVQYSCFKNCENSENELSILEHNQKNCKLRINCMENCLFVAQNFIDLQNHFISKHNIRIVLVTDSNYNGLCVSSDTKYMLFCGHIIRVTGETINNECYVGAEICNKWKINEQFNLIVTVSYNERKIGTLFNTKLKVDKHFTYVNLNFMIIQK